MNKSLSLIFFVSWCCFSFTVSSVFSQSYHFIQDNFSSIEGDITAEKKILELVNAERKKAGLSELSYDVSLQSAARQHSQEMLKLNYFSHTSPSENLKNPSDRVYRTGLTDYVVGENIAVHSLDVSPKQVAEHLMIQWMNSPGHRANILRPEFTHMGAGVISIKDSIVKDTLVKGMRGRLVVYTIRHYGTQVFTSRNISFSKLELSKSTSEFLIFDLQFEYDRGVLASFNNYSQFFQPSGKKMVLHVEYPLQPQIQIYLARIQNDYTQEYVAFFEDNFVYENVMRTIDKLAKIPFPIISKEIKISKKALYFLKGEGTVALRDSNTQCLLHIENDRYYELAVIQNKIQFNIPIEADGKIKKISIAAGSGREKPVKNYLMIDTEWLDKTDNQIERKVFVKN